MNHESALLEFCQEESVGGIGMAATVCFNLIRPLLIKFSLLILVLDFT